MLNHLLPNLMQDHRRLIELAVALLLGALIGIQRGWKDREREAGQRVAGVRTHTLTALTGALGVILSEHLGSWVLVALMLSIATVGVVAYRQRVQTFHDLSITGLIGLLMTFLFGALAALGELELATSAAVVTALILDNKAEIHGLLNKLRAHELDAGLKLLLISVVVLPLLPDRGFGPDGIINPYQIWWMVVLIAAISFVGYFAMRVGGAEKGILFTGLFAGLSSSTALTLHFSRLARDMRELNPLFAAGILIACGTMFPRILIVCAVINRSLLPQLAPPALVMMGLLYLPALMLWYRHRHHVVDRPQMMQNPLELRTAIGFGLLLVIIMGAGEFLRNWLGDLGVYLLSATSGISDVDAITLSLARMSGGGLSLETAVTGIIIAASVNSVVKAAMALFVGPPGLSKRVALPMTAAVIAGLTLAWSLLASG